MYRSAPSRVSPNVKQPGRSVRTHPTHRPLRGERIPLDHIVANPWPEILMRGPRVLGLRWPAGDYLKAVTFDRWAARHVEGCDVWVGFGLFSLVAQRAAREPQATA